MTDAERMIDLLQYASQKKVADALGVSKTTTGQWARGLDVTPFRLRQVEDLLRPQRAGEPPTGADELLSEMRSIRQMLQRRSAPAVNAQKIAAALLQALNQQGAVVPISAPRRPKPVASRIRKGARQEAEAR